MHPKTIVNRKNIKAKTGLEISDYRDESAFRTAKSRALKKLRTSNGWATLSSNQQEEAEERVITDLEAKLDAKKRIHELEWMKQVEDCDDADAEVLDFNDEKNPIQDSKPIESGTNETDDGWYTESDSDKCLLDDCLDESDKEQMIRTLEEIRKESGTRWQVILNAVEEKAKQKEDEWHSYIRGQM